MSEISRNIFRYATSEFSQDAMIAWLISCATAANTTLKTVGRAFVRFLLQADLPADGGVIEKAVVDSANETRPYDGPGEVSEVLRLEPQYKRIDVYCCAEIDGRTISFVIEDKTGTTEHSNQLRRYRQAVQTDNIHEDFLKLIYLKTGMPYDDELKRAADAGFSFVGISDLSRFFENEASIADAMRSSDLLRQFHDFVVDERRKQERATRESDVRWGPLQYRFGERLFEGLESSNWRHLIPRGYRISPIRLGKGTSTGGTSFTQLRFAEHLFWRMDSYRPHLRLMSWLPDRRENKRRVQGIYQGAFGKAVEATGRTLDSVRVRQGSEMTIGAIRYPNDGKLGDDGKSFLNDVVRIHCSFLDQVARSEA